MTWRLKIVDCNWLGGASPWVVCAAGYYDPLLGLVVRQHPVVIVIRTRW